MTRVRGRDEVKAIFARLFDDQALRDELLWAGDDDARRGILRRHGFRGDYTIADVEAEVRQLLAVPLPAEAPFHVKQARRAAPFFGRFASAGCRRRDPFPSIPEVRASYAVVGTMKGGTTALDHFLSQHPSICTAVQKETHFFCRDMFFEPDPPAYEWYSMSFSVSFAGQEVVGEASPDYMYNPKVPPRIRSYNPGMKLVFLLRDPVARAYSDYCMRVSRQLEHRSFHAVVDEELDLLARGEDVAPQEDEVVPRYLGAGFYTRFVRRFLELFPPDQLLLLRSEELLEEHERTLARVHAFLGVGSEVIPPARVLLKGSGPPIEPAEKRRLLDLYEAETEELERLTGWDLRSWRA